MKTLLPCVSPQSIRDTRRGGANRLAASLLHADCRCSLRTVAEHDLRDGARSIVGNEMEGRREAGVGDCCGVLANGNRNMRRTRAQRSTSPVGSHRGASPPGTRRGSNAVIEPDEIHEPVARTLAQYQNMISSDVDRAFRSGNVRKVLSPPRGHGGGVVVAGAAEVGSVEFVGRCGSGTVNRGTQGVASVRASSPKKYAKVANLFWGQDQRQPVHRARSMSVQSLEPMGVTAPPGQEDRSTVVVEPADSPTACQLGILMAPTPLLADGSQHMSQERRDCSCALGARHSKPAVPRQYVPSTRPLSASQQATLALREAQQRRGALRPLSAARSITESPPVTPASGQYGRPLSAVPLASSSSPIQRPKATSAGPGKLAQTKAHLFVSDASSAPRATAAGSVTDDDSVDDEEEARLARNLAAQLEQATAHRNADSARRCDGAESPTRKSGGRRPGDGLIGLRREVAIARDAQSRRLALRAVAAARFWNKASAYV
jgi:hypothetical protein